MSTPLVSIVTPAYNAAPYIGATARTVVAQSLDDWEWVIVDDGSTDSTAQIVKGLGDPRIRVVHAPHSGLPASARNRGIAQARGELIAFLDADDLWEPEKLALQLAFLGRHPEVGLVFSRFYHWVDRHERPREVLPDTNGLPNPGWMLPQLVAKNRVGTSTVVVRRELLARVGGFDEDPAQRGTEDFELWLRLAAQSQFGYVDRPLVWYRIHSANLSGGQSSLMDGHLLALDKAFARHPDLYERPQLSGARMAARRLRLRGSGRLFDCVGDCGRHELARSLKIWPFDGETWKWYITSLIGPTGIRRLRRISRAIH